MKEINGRMYCSKREWLERVADYLDEGDSIVTGYVDEHTALIFRNSANCMLSAYLIDTGETRTF